MHLKTIGSLFISLLLTTFIYGQAKTADPIPSKLLRNTNISNLPIAQPRVLAMDTILPPIFIEDDCSLDLFSFFNNQGWGFVGGMNEYMDLEKAQRFYYNQENYSLTELSVFFATVDIVGDGDIFAKIYEVDEGTDGPGTLVGISNPMRVSDLAVDEFDVLETVFSFPTPPEISGDQFFVSIDFAELYDSQDTVSLLMSDLECGIDGDAWELFSDGETWVSMSDSLSWGISSNIFMIAAVETDGLSTTKELLGANGAIRLKDAFPNPTNGLLTIAYDLEIAAEVSVEIYTATGQLYREFTKENLIPGTYQNQVFTDNFPVGTYFYGITTDKGRLMNKFVVKE